MNRFKRIVCIAMLSLSAPAVFAAGSEPAPSAPKDPVLEKVTAATAAQDWAGAQSLLRDALARDPRNADYHNLYAYALRKGPNPDMSAVFQHYNQALAIDPKHRGAHEYLGEAYLMVGNLPKAKEELATLDKLCFFPCDEYALLKKSVSEYETKQAAR
ncbi:MAG TPA: tetratricopeptide repeat protein [Burkholderiales bacterium]|jgi:Tfp pilus assembly protein PilF|nr:tetratricopeptide repeat protein [Burkholderiales bacterium]